MKNILVPVDFSEPAKHAAYYAIALANDLGAEKIILYNAYQQPMPSDPVLLEPAMSTLEGFNVSDLSNVSKEHLELFKKEIQQSAPSQLQIDTIGEFNDLVEGIQEICVSEQVDIIVTGITIGDKITEALVGSHALDIARQSKVPVLIIPKEAAYKKIENILFASDYKQVKASSSLTSLQQLVTETGAGLHILHVKETDKDDTAITGSQTLKNLLQDLTPQFHEIRSNNFAETINSFIAQNNIDLLVAIPKKHGFFDSFFRRSHIKTLAFRTHIPLMLVHEA